MYSEYQKCKLEDGVVVKSKFVLINAMTEKSLEQLINEAKEKKESKIGMWIYFQSRSVLGVDASKKLRGSPSAPCMPQELQDSIIKKDMDFEVIKKRRNEYKLKNGIVIFSTLVRKTSNRKLLRFTTKNLGAKLLLSILNKNLKFIFIQI